MNKRTASCACSDVSLTVDGEPERVVRCHCDYCQRRTGNVFQTAAWFFSDQIVERKGTPKKFNETETNPGVDYYFCPRCGSTVFWKIPRIPEICVVAVGCFADKTFPPPNFEIRTSNKHDWVQELDITDTFEGNAPIEKWTLKPKTIE